MNKTLIIVLVISLALIAFLGIKHIAFRRLSLVSVSSPTGLNHVELFDENSLTSLLLFSRKVRFSHWKNNENRVRNQRLIELDGFSSEFSKQFSSFLWIDDRTLRIGRNSVPNLEEGDQILIHNRSSNPISYFLINSWDLFLIFDPKLDERLLITVPHQKRSSNRWLRIDVGFSDGRVINRSVDSVSRDVNVGRLTYCITIEDNERIAIGSPDENRLEDSSMMILMPRCDQP